MRLEQLELKGAGFKHPRHQHTGGKHTGNDEHLDTERLVDQARHDL
jgi:hypothetical protein